MSQNGPIREEKPRDEEIAGGSESVPESRGPAGELSFDDLPHTRPRPPDETPYVHKLQERVAAALDDVRAEVASDGAAETIERWPLQVQALCILGGSALCWAVILTPFLLF